MTPVRKALVVLIPIAVVLAAVSGLHRHLWYGYGAGIAHDREGRLAPIIELAPVPLPTALPLLGPAGRNADGEQTQYVDRPALRSLLFHGAHADLTRYLEQLQAEFEADPRCEYWPIDAGDAFSSAEPGLLAKLDAWVAATPDSFAPYLARAAHWRAVAQARRGADWALSTPGADFSAMRDAVVRGLADTERALALRPKLVAARRLQILMAGLDGDRGLTREAVDKAIAVCPTCFQVRVAYIYSLTPRWGGSHGAMDAFARAAVDPSRPRLRLLTGYADLDRARTLRGQRQLGAARAALEPALALGEHWDFLLERAAIELADNKIEAALDALDRAAALRPGSPFVLGDRARARAKAKRWEDAASDLLAVLRVDPTDSDARSVHGLVVENLARAAWEHHRADHRDDAARVIHVAFELAPANVKVLQVKAAIEAGSAALPQALDVLERAVREQPDSLPAHLALDEALSGERRFERVVAMWSAYLARHPNEGRAYLERGGAHYHLGRRAEARSDATKACELGVTEGCEREKQTR
ncbi:GTP cyclohydrolase III (methanopterin) [Minicystis rosea]|nr:GTP cyclohydrolase III (methanopterin) [Minicystis rosea]